MWEAFAWTKPAVLGDPVKALGAIHGAAENGKNLA
jgi:hypothetical protein